MIDYLVTCGLTACTPGSALGLQVHTVPVAPPDLLTTANSFLGCIVCIAQMQPIVTDVTCSEVCVLGTQLSRACLDHLTK